MKERPILFSGPMVQAILNGKKTQTRRIVKEPRDWFLPKGCSPYGMAGDRLWVRETWATHATIGAKPSDLPVNTEIYYRADIPERDSRQSHHVWRPSIFMPRWASRITLEVVKVRVERLKEITEEDAIAEGCKAWKGVPGDREFPAVYDYYRLWNSINAKRGFGWDVNPWVWVIEFKKVSDK